MEEMALAERATGLPMEPAPAIFSRATHSATLGSSTTTPPRAKLPMRNRKREICTSGSARGGGGNIPTYSAQAVLANVELTSIVADDHTVAEKAMGYHAAPQRAFGGDQHWIRIDLEGRDSEPLKMVAPGNLIGKASVGMLDQASNHMGG